ncbi:MAG: hypothetical protein ACI857_000295 [Arenicella sp.]|jgi:hypothetical protein
MLVNLYESKTPIAIFSLPIVASLLGITIFFIEPHAFSMPFEWQNTLFNNVQSIPWLNYLITILLTSTIAHQLNNVYNQSSFYSKASFLPGFIYICCLISFNCFYFAPSLIAHLFFVWGLGQFLKLRRQEQAKAIIFQGSILFGIAFIFSPLQIGLILLPWLGLTIFRPFVWREWIMVLGGLVVPLLYYFSALYLLNDHVYLFKNSGLGFIALGDLHLLSWINYVIFGAIVIGSIAKFIGVSRSQVNRFKLQSQVLLHFLWLALVAYFLGWYFYNLSMVGIIIPLSIIIGTQLLHNRNLKVVNGIVIIWLIISVANVILVG